MDRGYSQLKSHSFTIIHDDNFKELVIYPNVLSDVKFLLITHH